MSSLTASGTPPESRSLGRGFGSSPFFSALASRTFAYNRVCAMTTDGVKFFCRREAQYLRRKGQYANHHRSSH